MSDIFDVSFFTKIMDEDEYNRDMAYEYCRGFFIKNQDKSQEKEIKELMSLHLFAYLAGFGMFRNQLLLNKSFLFHEEVIEMLWSDNYYDLSYFNPFKDDHTDKINKILSLSEKLSSYYTQKGYFADYKETETKIERVTDTLITKVMMGTLGCVPAYDGFVKRGLRSLGLSQTFNKDGLLKLFEWVCKNEEKILEARKKIGHEELYTPMRVVDLILWKKGYDDIGK